MAWPTIEHHLCSFDIPFVSIYSICLGQGTCLLQQPQQCYSVRGKKVSISCSLNSTDWLPFRWHSKAVVELCFRCRVGEKEVIQCRKLMATSVACRLLSHLATSEARQVGDCTGRLRITNRHSIVWTTDRGFNEGAVHNRKGSQQVPPMKA